MMSSRFDLGPTLKTLNLSILQFIERSKFQNYTPNDEIMVSSLKWSINSDCI